MKCKICENETENREFKIKEMMFGFRDEFIYLQCANCGCLQISEIPRNMGKYYPSNYSSFKKTESGSSIRQILKRERNKYSLFKKGLLGRIAYILYRNTRFNIDIISKIKINYNSRILDVGCGAGRYLLYPLSEIGLKNLVGVDPYINREINTGVLKIYKKSIHELADTEEFDVIVFSHSFEHIAEQKETLLKVRKILSEDGICLIRIPVKTEYIWNRYGVNWVQIDAPRHLFIHTLKSFQLLVEKSGLVIQDVIFDSTELQFWGSEQYKRGIPYKFESSYLVNPQKSMFTAREIKKFRTMADELNIKKQGDQAAFYLINE